MYFQTVKRLRMTTKMQLATVAREQYTHTGLQVFPDGFVFSLPVLVVSVEIARDYQAVLLADQFHFVLCTSVLEGMEEDLCGWLNRLRVKYTRFDDAACTETAAGGMDVVLSYLRARHPEAEADVLTVDNLEAYLRPFPDMMDILHCQDAALTPELMTAGLREYYIGLESLHRKGTVTRGTLIVSSIDSRVGEVVSTNSRVAVSGAHMNRAMHGDEVYVENGDVVGVHRAKTRVIVGSLFRIEGLFGFVRPVDRRLPDFVVRTGLSPDYIGRKVAACVLGWPVASIYPRAVIYRVLGRTGDVEDELEAIGLHFGIDYLRETWPGALARRRVETGEMDNTSIDINADIKETTEKDSAMAIKAPVIQQQEEYDLSITQEERVNKRPAIQAEKDKKFRKTDFNNKEEGDERSPEGLGFRKEDFSIEVAYKELKNGSRADLRDLCVCSIDPIGCTDIDDALHCVERKDTLEIGVHIADVSLYVQPGTALDKEAAHRSTTVYFPDRRIDMLPAFLSSDLCSLRPGEDKAAVSVTWLFDKNLNVLDIQIQRSVIRSRAALSYEEAHAVLCGESSTVPQPCAVAIRTLMRVADVLRQRRIEKGALDLSAQEVGVDALGTIKVKEPIPTHHLVEEFMLLANTSVARFLQAGCPEYTLLRKHPLPSAIDLDGIDCSSSSAINASLAHADPRRVPVLKKIITRSMQQAVYFVSGDAADFSHYGLATDIYTHFTSPIRRYPDIVVHRILGLLLANDQPALDRLALSVTTRACSYMNYRHRNAQNASRAFTSLLLYNALPEGPLPATVIAERQGGYIIYVQKYGIEEFIETDTILKMFDTITVSFHKDIVEYCTSWRINFHIVY